MVHNILLTGAAGYIGGTILTDLLACQDGPVKAAKLFAAVRTQEQVELLSKLAGVSVAQVDLLRKDAVEDYVHRNEIDFIVNLAPSFDLVVVSNLLSALGKRRQDGANDLRLINSSVTAAFSKENGWPFGEISDTGPVIAKEKEIGDQHPVRVADIMVAEKGKELGVKTYIVVIPNVYGKGTGQGRKQSVSIPTYVRVSIRNQIVNKFDQDGHPAAAHVTDLAALYVLLIEKILQGDPIPSDEVGIYFGVAYTMSWWKVMSAIARALHSQLETKAELLTRLRSQVPGNFLWAAVMVESMEIATSTRKIWNVVGKGLPEDFEKFLEKRIQAFKPVHHAFIR
ncbi:nad dependent epimerase dehydratase family protein [Colletotrichum tabaci]|uniref:Nad dependent epimerase dehydratase family protein n=1 Tax=Colletotrichum tabaci TaxID=1209068 RepID=A0AAV9TAY7_9PEZI